MRNENWGLILVRHMLTPVLNSEPYTKLAENVLKVNESPRRTRALEENTRINFSILTLLINFGQNIKE